jgi:hypothetical protein
MSIISTSWQKAMILFLLFILQDGKEFILLSGATTYQYNIENKCIEDNRWGVFLL